MKYIVFTVVVLAIMLSPVMTPDQSVAQAARESKDPYQICYHNKEEFGILEVYQSCEMLHIELYNGDPLHPPKEHPDGSPTDCKITREFIYP
jgi:hypothetical protein